MIACKGQQQQQQAKRKEEKVWLQMKQVEAATFFSFPFLLILFCFSSSSLLFTPDQMEKFNSLTKLHQFLLETQKGLIITYSCSLNQAHLDRLRI